MARTKKSLMATTVVAAVVIVAVAVAISQAGGSSGTGGGAVRGAAATGALFRGIPQNGITLGDPRAPVTLTEFGDLQCPFCRQYSEAVLPTLVNRYVRTGEVRLVFRNLAFIGPDSGRAARVAAAAGLQDRLWQFTQLAYRNQGAENSGYVTDSYLRGLAEAAGVHVARAFKDSKGGEVSRQLEAALREARRFHVDLTPYFLLTRTGRQPQRLSPSSLTVAQFTTPIDKLVGRGQQAGV